MSWDKRYVTPDKTIWQGRSDAPANTCLFQIIQPLDLNDILPSPPPDKIAFGLIGFCCDEGIRRNQGRIGAAEGPRKIRDALGKLAVQKQHFLCYDAGDITCTDGDLEAAQQTLATTVALLLKNHITPIVLGGGHELAWGHYQGITKIHPHDQLGIVNFDAHFDMRPLLPNHTGSSGSPFLQIATAHKEAHRRFDYNCIGIQHAGNIHPLFDLARNHHVQTILADDLHQGYMDKCVNFVDRVIDQNQLIYLSLCLDVFAACYAPGVSAPQALGLSPWQIIPLVRQLAASGKTISYDVAELSPTYDIDSRTAKLAAHFIYEILHHHNKHATGMLNGTSK